MMVVLFQSIMLKLFFDYQMLAYTCKICEGFDTEVAQKKFISNMDNSKWLIIKVNHEHHSTNVNLTQNMIQVTIQLLIQTTIQVLIHVPTQVTILVGLLLQI